MAAMRASFAGHTTPAGGREVMRRPSMLCSTSNDPV
jgi:hypothetical protein